MKLVSPNNGGNLTMETVTQLIKHYKEIQKRNNTEYIDLGQVINDLYQIKRHQQLMKIPKEDR